MNKEASNCMRLFGGNKIGNLIFLLLLVDSTSSEGSMRLPNDSRLLPKHVGASIYNKSVKQSVHIVGHFYY
jgi:hypothetical protein